MYLKVACAAALGLTVAFAGCAGAEELSANRQLAHDIYKELLEIDTTTATGDAARAAEAMAARLKAAGFPEADVRVLSPAPRKGNLVARLHGSGARRPILLLAHLDVVPALRADPRDRRRPDHRHADRRGRAQRAFGAA